MRRQLAVLVAAITVMIVVSFTIPLALLVQRQAENRAKVIAEREAQTLASLVALNASTLGDSDLESGVGELPSGMTVWLADGTQLGNAEPGQGGPVETARATLTPVSGDVEGGGWEVAIPVVTPGGVMVVDAFVSPEDLEEGVVGAWLLLGLLGLVLIIVAVLVGDRMARRLVRPVSELAGVARELGDGNLAARSEVDEPAEFREVGNAFNYLAGRLGLLLAQEREIAADLSHRLRTPLTSLRLRADGLSSPEERYEMLASVDRLEHAVDQLITASRAPRSEEGSESDLVAAVNERARFWRVLADEQRRDMEVSIPDGQIVVPVPREAVDSAIDVLVGNVFDHTPEETPFSVEVTASPVPSLKVSDHGPGLPAGDVAKRGVSGSGSTGLGLDIARRVAESGGGTLQIDDRPGGGAIITIHFG